MLRESSTRLNEHAQNLHEQESLVRMLCVDRQVLLRDALAHRLGQEPGLRVVACASDLEECGLELNRLNPDIVLLELGSLGSCFFDGLRQLAELGTLSKVLIVGSKFNDHFLERALALGVRGFVLKSDPLQSLIRGIKRIQEGGSHFSVQLESRIIRDNEGCYTVKRAACSLSPRELEVLRHLATGLAKKQIAEVLGISVKTVEGHAQHLMRKLEIHNRVDLARYAIREGLVGL